jgi:pyridoxamine 5'-phosphate oxidase family protein
MAFTDAELDYLAGQPLGRVATAQPNGTLQVSPVGFRYNSRTNTVNRGNFDD